MITTTLQALDEMIRLIAQSPPAALNRLHHCQLCRNHLLYLLDTIPVTGDSGRITARLGALPEVHKAHARRPKDHPDNASPQIRWITA